MLLLQDKLAELLNISKSNHKKEILKQETLKLAMIYCKIHCLNGNFGYLIEHYISKTYNLQRVSRNIYSGDFYTSFGNVELKCSLGTKEHNKFNFVQIRPSQDCNYFLICYYLSFENIDNLGDLYIFNISKENMINLLSMFGNYAHGSIKSFGKISYEKILKTSHEYCLRPVFGNKLWKELLKFRVNDIII